MKENIQCDECGRMVNAIHRKHKELKFCAACYKRTFNYTECPKCHQLKRLYKYDSEAICINCERAKPCIRCGKEKYKIGKKTSYGPVCRSCYSYFREEKPCSSCGELSRRLSTYKQFKVSQPICPKCSNKYRGTCVRCKRHRTLDINASGEGVCKKCSKSGYIKCPSCNSLYPAGYGEKCENCYYLSLFNKRLNLNVECVKTSTIKALFSSFSDWLLQSYKLRKAAIVINKHLVFFQTVDSTWGHLPSPESLLEHFGAEGLRHHRTVMKYLDEKHHYALPEKQKREHSAIQRVTNIVASFGGNKEATIVLSHYKNIILTQVNQKKIKPNTARVYLNAAKGLLELGWPVTSDLINIYLYKAPGQQASLTKFINFLNINFGIPVKLSKKPTSQIHAGNRDILKKLIARLKQVKPNNMYEDQYIISLSLQYFHGVPQNIAQKANNITICKDTGGVTVNIHGALYWLPKFNNLQ